MTVRRIATFAGGLARPGATSLRVGGGLRAALDALAAAGMAATGADPAVRAAFLLVDNLAVLLRDHLAEVLGTDPLSGPGMARWAGEVLAIYGAGPLAAPPPDIG